MRGSVDAILLQPAFPPAVFIQSLLFSVKSSAHTNTDTHLPTLTHSTLNQLSKLAADSLLPPYTLNVKRQRSHHITKSKNSKGVDYKFNGRLLFLFKTEVVLPLTPHYKFVKYSPVRLQRPLKSVRVLDKLIHCVCNT